MLQERIEFLLHNRKKLANTRNPKNDDNASAAVSSGQMKYIELSKQMKVSEILSTLENVMKICKIWKTD